MNAISDYRDSEREMPDSPDSKSGVQTTVSPPSSAPNMIPMPSRSISTGSSVSGMNGSHSPHSSINGRTPSPPSMGNSTSSQQLPPACGARQLSKLKRFLTTLQQFGSDISPEIGDRVRSLVLGLVNSHLSIEEFHGKLQEATNFPLRPFVIPFLKANLPLLQRELLHCARMAKQTPQQYLAHNEQVLFDPAHSPLESQEIMMPDTNENGKRRLSPDRPKENGTEPLDPIHPAKRHQTTSPGNLSNTSRVSPNSSLNLNVGGPIRLEDLRDMRERERLERERMDRERERHFSGYGFQRPDAYMDHLDRIDDDWKHVESMLHHIVGMVDKTKRALDVLRERSQRDREELSIWMRRHAEGVDQDMKKRTNEMMVHTLRQTEDRVTEVKRRAEEAVNEVKRQAVSELQKAVAAAEQKAGELVAAERLKMERAVAEARKAAHDEFSKTINHQEESAESCWNCGRKASETCSGCNVARYCGSYCQHKDWENHHHVCGTPQAGQGHMGSRHPPTAPPQNSTSTSTTTTSTATSSSASTVSPGSSAASPSNSAASGSRSRSSTPADPKNTDVSR